ncbi:TPA: hypothetical protein ACYLN4_000273 [Burkholderia lata]
MLSFRKILALHMLFVICMVTLIALGTWLSVSNGLPGVLFDHVVLYMLAEIVLSCGFVGLVGICSKGISRNVVFALITVWAVLSASLGVSLLWAPQLFHGNALLSVVAVLWALGKMWSLYRAFKKQLVTAVVVAGKASGKRFLANIEAEERAAEMAMSPEEKERQREEKERQRQRMMDHARKLWQRENAVDAFMAAHPGATREEAIKAAESNEA